MNVLRPDVVFDCNVFLQALARDKGPAGQAFRLVDQNAVSLHVSKAILSELRRILAYPEIRERNPHVTQSVIDSFLDHIRFRGTVHREIPRVMQYPRDPWDEPYLNLAIAIEADYVVTRDQDLLDLATSHAAEAKQLRQHVPNFQIVTPETFIAALGQAAG
jgi:uncharacterized protein